MSHAENPAGGKYLYGLYDTDGILRFLCADKEACIAYAELFDLPAVDCSLMSLGEFKNQNKSRKFKKPKKENQEESNN